MGGPDVSYPAPTQAEQDLQVAQADALKRQNAILEKQLRQQDLLAPFFLKSAGLQAITDSAGNVTGYRETPKTPEQLRLEQTQKRFMDLTLAELEAQNALAPQRADISRLTADRTLAALRGELPADPTLLRSLDEQEQDLRGRLFKQLGPDYETSTPGIEALATFNQRKQEVITGANRAELTLGEQFDLARNTSSISNINAALPWANFTENLHNSRLGEVLNFNNMPFNSAGGFGQLASGYSGPLSAMRADRAGQFQASYANAQNEVQSNAALLSTIGTVAGMGLGWGLAPAAAGGFGATNFGKIFGK